MHRITVGQEHTSTMKSQVILLALLVLLVPAIAYNARKARLTTIIRRASAAALHSAARIQTEEPACPTSGPVSSPEPQLFEFLSPFILASAMRNTSRATRLVLNALNNPRMALSALQRRTTMISSCAAAFSLPDSYSKLSREVSTELSRKSDSLIRKAYRVTLIAKMYGKFCIIRKLAEEKVDDALNVVRPWLEPYKLPVYSCNDGWECKLEKKCVFGLRFLCIF